MTLHGTSPLVIGHRGASGQRPEHSAAAYRRAFRQGADSVETDVVATRDGVLVCRHDLELSLTTDVASRPELAHLRRTMVVGGAPVTGWFVHDLTLEQVRTLRCVERWPEKRPGSAFFDGLHPVLTLAELFELVDDETARRGQPLGVHVELKHPDLMEAAGHHLPDLVEDVRRPRVTWMSFDATVLRGLHGRGRADLVLLLTGSPSGRRLAQTATWATGIGVRRKVVLPRDHGGLGAPTGIVGKAHRRGLEVLVWTHRAENKHLPKRLRRGPDPHGHGNARREAELLLDTGIDGLISDFPAIAHAARVGASRLPLAR